GVISRARAVRLGFLDFYSPFLILVRALAVVYLTFTYMQLSTTSEPVETKHGRPFIAVATCSKSGSEKHDTLNFGIFHVRATHPFDPRNVSTASSRFYAPIPQFF
ncbi:hypothetical protein B0H14DRAFT_2757169, partial [Mycena olivaceomarginata]